MSVTALPAGKPSAVRIARMAGRKTVSILRQLLVRNGPAWLWLRNEVTGLAAWARRRQRAALIGLLTLAVIGLAAGWLAALKWAVICWAVTRVPRERAQRRYVTFQAAATITRTPLEVSASESMLTFSRGTKRAVRPRSRVHVRRWIPLRIFGLPLPLGTIPQRGVISYDPRWFHDHHDDARRNLFENVINQRLHGRLTNIEYRFDWQPQYCRVAFRVLPPLLTGKLAYAHQEHLAWHRLPVGRDRQGRLVVIDIEGRGANPAHVLISGDTGSGKTSVANVMLAHTLRFAQVEHVFVDMAEMDFGWLAELPADHNVRYAQGELREATAAIRTVLHRAERRRKHQEACTPLMLWLEEFPELVDLAKERDHSRNAPDEVLWVRRIMRIGRKTNIHVICITQQPNVDVFGSSESRDQFGWQVLAGNPSTEHAKMLSASGLTIPDLATPGRVAVIRNLTQVSVAHAYWLASPTGPDATNDEKAEAARWLPIAKPTQVTVTAVSREPVTGQVDAEEVPTPHTTGQEPDRAPVVPIRRRRSS
jgi:hypothetical protein